MSFEGSWSTMPAEILEKIFNYRPRIWRPILGEVCTHWWLVLHGQALNYLKLCIKKQLINEEHLERFEWWSHPDHAATSSCCCIELAFRPFSHNYEVLTKYIPEVGERLHTTCAVTASKMFFGRARDVGDHDDITVLAADRLQPNSLPRVLHKEGLTDGATAMAIHLYSCGDLLVLLKTQGGDQPFRLQDFSISLWSLSEERYIQDLDFKTHIPDDLDEYDVQISDIALSRRMLAVNIFSLRDVRTLLWHVDTTANHLLQPQFLTDLRYPLQVGPEKPDYIENEGFLYLNEKYLVSFVRFVWEANKKRDHKLLVYQAEDAEDGVAPAPCCLEQLPSIHPMEVKLEWTIILKLEPGRSSRMAVFCRRLAFLQILDLATGHKISQVSCLINSTLYEANWWGGYLIFLQKEDWLQDPGYRVVTFDPDQPCADLDADPGALLEDNVSKMEVDGMPGQFSFGSFFQSKAALLDGQEDYSIRVDFSGISILQNFSMVQYATSMR